MKRNMAFVALALFLSVASFPAQGRTIDADALNVNELEVRIDDAASTLSVRLGFDPARFRVGNEREIILTPMLVAADGTDSLAMRPVTIAGRARWYHYMRDGMLTQGCDIYRAGVPGAVRYEETCRLEPWMRHSTLEVRAQTANCCDPAELMQGPSSRGYVPVAQVDYTSDTFNAPFVFAPPVDGGPVKKELQGSAFVTFVVNRTELKPDYMRNRAELQKIINSIEQVRHDPEAEISEVHIKGFASPEGPYSNNVRLATGRTETLRRYVRDLYHFPDSTVTSSFDPEDWQGLRRYVKDSLDYRLANRENILMIIDSDMEPDAKDALLKRRFPDDYKVLLDEIYPWLRRSDYAVRYTIRTYTSLADIKRVYAEDPTRLRNVDFFTLAQSYPVGSDEYKEVMLKAVETYPDDAMINLNAANIAMDNGDPDMAQSYLLKSGRTPRAEYARGVLAARRGDFKSAMQFFDKARQGGVAEADGAYSDAERMDRDRYRVKYLVDAAKGKKK